MKSVLVYAAQVVTVAVVGYALWYFLYGKPDVALPVWLLICVAAAALGLTPYLFSALAKRPTKRSGGSGGSGQV
jgi:hypothetical protein